ncbi:Membrane associated serine protease, rhomboid family [Chitinophaga sp. YR627]|uniref:rhomboid family intramembrane serine protease n=1 Tax=Chitinophaga sp. YR627 TaxID=1881041 RepID=UPI0008E412E3|nr:rhomboid family intramembrane serine protease [Chitinophaga sp. YR627]SFN18820.1 Membrane associated serine protease, rhomboid family [Chitinophaga sp. YR627]
MKDKLNIIFKPYLVILLGLTIGYTFLHWLLVIRLGLLQLKEGVTHFGIPAGLTAVAAWIYLRGKFSILSLSSSGRSNLKDLYCMLTWLFLAMPVIIAQYYISTATGKLTQLNTIGEINKVPLTKYYALKTSYIGKKVVGIHPAFSVSGRQDVNYSMQLFVVVPILESEKDTSSKEPAAWLGIRYNKTISNRLDNNEKETKYQEFVSESEVDFEKKDLSAFVYLERMGTDNFEEGYINAIKSNPVYKPNGVVLRGVNKPFAERNGQTLLWLIIAALIGAVSMFGLLAISVLDERQRDRVIAGRPDRAAQREMKELLYFVKPRDGYFVTPILIYVNVGVSLLMMLSGLGFANFTAEDLLKWGANYGPLTKNGEWWRLLISTFLHAGIMHLFANMIGLLFIGVFLEPKLGRIRYLIVYLLTAVISAITSLWWHDEVVSVGASGAVFGLYGVFVALLITKVYPPEIAKTALVSTLVFIGYNLIMGMTGDIDNAAHIGGLVSGFVIGLILYLKLKQEVSKRTDAI